MRPYLLLLILLLTACTPALERFEYRRVIMGGEARLVLFAPSEPHARTAARAAYARLAELDRVMSDYRSDSELAALNRSHPDRFRAGDDLATVIARALAVSQATNGAFDITVGPLVKLWREAIDHGRLPDPERLEDARRCVGHHLVELDGRSITLRRAGMQLDLGGIGKGYAADEALRELSRQGVGRALVDLGGDIVAGDPPPGAPGWNVVAEHDEDTLRLVLVNQAVATSGDRFRFVEIDGIRYAHIVDPRTGYGLTGHRTATVVAPDGALADALASALAVRGPDGLAWIDSFPNAAGRITVDKDDARQTTSSVRFSLHKPGVGETER